MTIISQKGGNFWIESIAVARASVANNTTTNTDIELSRPGVFLGCSVSLDSALAEDETDDINLSLQVGGSNNALTVGAEITQIRLRRYNENAGALIFGAYILVYLRKRGVPA